MRRPRVHLFRLLVLGALVACGDELGPRIPAAVVVSPESATMVTGSTLQLTTEVVDATGEEIPGQTVAFRSSDPEFLAVDDTGLLTAPGFPGTAVITAASGDFTTEVDVTVVLPPSAIVGFPESLELNLFDEEWIFIRVTDENGLPIEDPELTIQSSDPAVVRVGRPGDDLVSLTGLAPGTATVTLTSGALSTEAMVTVGQFPTAVIITPRSVTLSPGGSQQLTATLLDGAGREIEEPHAVTWSSDNGAVVAVDANGVATAVGPEGTARITGTIGALSGSAGVFVGPAPAGEMLARVPLAGAHGVALDANGRYVVAASGTIASGALPDFAFPDELPLDGVLVDVALNASGTRAYVVREAGGTLGPGVAVIDLTTNSSLDFIPVSFGSPRSAAVSGEGSVLTVGTTSGLEVVNLTTKQSIGIAVGLVRKVLRHPSKPVLYATYSSGVLELDESSGEILRKFDGESRTFALAADGSRLYIMGIDLGTSVWNLETGEREPGLGVFGDEAAVTPDGKFLYVLRPFPDDSRLSIHDAASGIQVREVLLGGLARRITMSGDGTALITNGDGTEGWVDFVR